jgi:NTE family protein
MPEPIWKRKHLGLALGGGGARGIAHIGVLRVFEEESIPIDILVGTSIGALVGGAYASGLGTYELEKKTEEFLDSPTFQDSALKSINEIQTGKDLSLPRKIRAYFMNCFFQTVAMFRPGMLQSEAFQAMIDYFIPDIQIQDTQLPFRALATDLVSGEPVVISQGSLRKAVMASCAVPGMVPPLVDNGMLLSDGGITHMVPTRVAREEGAGLVVGVSLNRDLYSRDEFCSAIDVYVRSMDIGSFHHERCLIKEADVAILPRLGNLHWTDFGLTKELILEGERATREKLHLLRNALHVPKRWGPFRAILRYSNKRT